MKSEDVFPMPRRTLSPPIHLTIRGLGHVVSLKNSFYNIVTPEKREWKRRCVRSFLFQLSSSIPTTATGTPTARLPQSSTPSLPRNDTWKDIPIISIICVKVPPGQEGAE